MVDFKPLGKSESDTYGVSLWSSLSRVGGRKRGPTIWVPVPIHSFPEVCVGNMVDWGDHLLRMSAKRGRGGPKAGGQFDCAADFATEL